MWCVLHREGLHVFHLQRDQILQAEDYPRRPAFAQKSASVRHFPCFVLFSIEVSLTREEVVNKHSTHILPTLNQIYSNYHHYTLRLPPINNSYKSYHHCTLLLAPISYSCNKYHHYLLRLPPVNCSYNDRHYTLRLPPINYSCNNYYQYTMAFLYD
ncbi:hypothetical protein CDAR_605231 [Caerostris darwini]|uniref:Uncharacterized protein n=1 Tax=Caerostris darwini TaxID=1538125 RepID=A0AAV4U8Q3_9ARAC|nr:hypothetical protein CDAR_605231 [Caerostris darwini]